MVVNYLAFLLFLPRSYLLIPKQNSAGRLFSTKTDAFGCFKVLLQCLKYWRQKEVTISAEIRKSFRIICFSHWLCCVFSDSWHWGWGFWAAGNCGRTFKSTAGWCAKYISQELFLSWLLFVIWVVIIFVQNLCVHFAAISKKKLPIVLLKWEKNKLQFALLTTNLWI